ncbi:hypothetical protein CHISP_3015 [Chitinispirillum alkaliphilum]|nr:hypothetical protein CHISP_3015 [Chitinispirillum alkaliphilum]
MGFNPFSEKGTPLSKQTKTWSDLNVNPYDHYTVEPYTRTRCILMNGIEVEASFFYHNFHRHTSNQEIRQELAQIRRIEQQEQKMINWLIPSHQSTLELTIAYEQLAVDLTAAMAKSEPDPYVKAALDFGLLEDFDHLYRYANLLSLTDELKAEAIVKDLTEITPGRPTVLEHVHPIDTVRNHYNREKASAITKLHVETIIAAEQQTMNFYMTVGNRFENKIGRSLYQEIAQIEEQHVTHYGSLSDPGASWLEMAVLHEYNECYMYWSCMQSETNQSVKGIWEQCLENEISHLHKVSDLMKKYENTDPSEKFPSAFPEPLVLSPAKDYVREIISSQMHFTGDQTRFVPMKQAESKERFENYQDQVNMGLYIASQKVVQNAIDAHGQDYRVETEGENPVSIAQRRNKVPNRKSLTEFCLNQ